MSRVEEITQTIQELRNRRRDPESKIVSTLEHLHLLGFHLGFMALGRRHCLEIEAPAHLGPWRMSYLVIWLPRLASRAFGYFLR